MPAKSKRFVARMTLEREQGPLVAGVIVCGDFIETAAPILRKSAHAAHSFEKFKEYWEKQGAKFEIIPIDDAPEIKL